jgi:hypothetical protein
MAIEDLYGKVLAQALQVIRAQTFLPALVNHETDGDRNAPAQKGGQTEVIVPPEFVTRDVVPGPVPPASQGAPNPTTVPVPLNWWKEVNFPLTTKHVALLENADREVPMFLANAVAPIVEDMTFSIASCYTGIYNYVGNAGNTPFASTPADAQNAKKVLTKSKCPKFFRQMVLNTDAYGNATGLEAFRNVAYSGSSETLREGEVTRAYGFDWWEDVGMDDITHTTGAATAGTIAVDHTGGYAAGSQLIHIDGLTAKPAVGDVFSFATHNQSYTVVAASDLVGADADITIRPALKLAIADNVALTFKDSHAINLAFNPYCFAFDSRPAARLNIPGVTSNFMSWVDDMTGVTLRLEIRDEYHQTGFYLSCLWGAVLVDPRLGCRIAG